MSADRAIGLAVNQQIFARGIQAQELATPLGLTKSSASRKLRGNVSWSADEVLRTAMFFGIEPADLMPTPDGMGGWVPAPFKPGHYATPSSQTSTVHLRQDSNLQPRVTPEDFIVGIATISVVASFFTGIASNAGYAGPTGTPGSASCLSRATHPAWIAPLRWCVRMEIHALTLPVPAGWVEPLDRWEAFLIAGGRSNRTVLLRVWHMRLVARGLTVDPCEVQEVSLMDWLAAQSWTSETRYSYYCSIRLFYRWYTPRYGLTANPAADLPTVRRRPGVPRPIGEDVLATAIRRAQVNGDKRVELILMLAATAGLRAGKVARVHAQDLVSDRSGTSLIVLGKGGRERIVPLHPETAQAVTTACRMGGGWAFPGQDNGHLSPMHVSKLAAAALPGHWTLHALRHWYATRVYQAEQDLLITQRLLGHASVETTQRYAEPPESALIAARDAAALPASPRPL